jgi:hypothetical protein
VGGVCPAEWAAWQTCLSAYRFRLHTTLANSVSVVHEERGSSLASAWARQGLWHSPAARAGALAKIYRQAAETLLPAATQGTKRRRAGIRRAAIIGDSRWSACARCALGYRVCHESAFIGPTHAAFFLACLFFVPK